RATIANMGAELGVTTSVFPSDQLTLDFLSAQQRGESWKEILPDQGADYERVIDVDLSRLEPMIACPHSPDNIKKVKELRGMKINQVAIGSCTNSSYKDLVTVARIVAGKQTVPNLSFIVAPGSKQVLEMIARNGSLSDILASGARIMETACGFCIGSGQAPFTDGVSLRTNNRNFEGRSGTASGQIYLVSPETAALSALAGELVDPMDYPSVDYPYIPMPEDFHVDDSMIIPPSKFPVEIFRGPNIGAPPHTEPLSDKIIGRIELKVGDKITTDHIMPAGSRLKYRSNIPEYSKYVFEGIAPSFAATAGENKKNGIFTAIAGGHSYGQGSSREHAAICPMYLGVRLVMVKSFERIHSANLINFGILPLVFKNENDYDIVKEGSEFSANNLLKHIAEDEIVPVEIDGRVFEFALFASKRQRDILLAGGLLNYTRS
ncbi:MAG: aconitase family protein, partial [Leptospirales bacterium]|nr:aconitase family protein [Leptospirales bacterium]